MTSVVLGHGVGSVLHWDTQMKIALGVSGGIAAYKAAEVLRLLQERGVRVQVA